MLLKNKIMFVCYYLHIHHIHNFRKKSGLFLLHSNVCTSRFRTVKICNPEEVFEVLDSFVELFESDVL